MKLRFGSKSISNTPYEHKHFVSNRLAKEFDKSTVKRSDSKSNNCCRFYFLTTTKTETKR